MSFNQLQDIQMFCVGTNNLRSLEAITGVSGLDNVVSSGPVNEDIPSKTVQQDCTSKIHQARAGANPRVLNPEQQH